MITIPGVDPRMIANNLEPSEPIHPGGLLKDEVECRGLTQRELAEHMGISHTVLNEILNCKCAVTTEYALLFEAALGIEAGIWIRIQAAYDMQVAKHNKSFVERLAKVRQITAAAL
ncbi:MAG: HigA family addiction module antidote protein [Odoribacteraceae bacterium]|jgi:addiction module HigA family antidote|nr:HigA family addiction module antidote protein [Odoribacteraceae bacterium]